MTLLATGVRRAARAGGPPPALALAVAGGLSIILAACGGGSGGSAGPAIAAGVPEVLAAFGQAADPALAVDPETGDLLMSWLGETGGEWNLYFARSTDGGATFGQPVRVNDVPGEAYPHAEGAPRLVAAPGVVALFWNDRSVVEGRTFAASNLRFARSTDGGRTWSPAIDLQDPLEFEGLPPRAHSFFGAAWNGGTTLAVAWIDGREADRRRVERGLAAGLPEAEAARRVESFKNDDDPHDSDAVLYAAVSHDLGATWAPANVRGYPNVCNCCRVAMVADPEGNLIAGWRRHGEGGVRDLVVGWLLDGAGRPITDRSVPIHEDGWVISGCPHSGPGLHVDGAGTLHAAWYTGAPGRSGVYYARMPAGAAAFGAPVPIVTGDAVPVANPAVTTFADGSALVAVNVDGEGRRVILLAGVTPEGKVAYRSDVAGSEGGTHPQMVRLPDGSVFLAWNQSRGGVEGVRTARVPAPGGSGS